LKLEHDELLSNIACFAFNCDLRRYAKVVLTSGGHRPRELQHVLPLVTLRWGGAA